MQKLGAVLRRLKLKHVYIFLNCLPVEQSVCEECQVVEDECHVIMHCLLYTDIGTNYLLRSAILLVIFKH